MMEPYQQLELEWARFNGLDPAGMVACSSGTAALHLALEAFRLPPGSEVIVPDFTMIACPRAVVAAGLTPVFVDCDERLLIDPDVVDGILLGMDKSDMGEPDSRMPAAIMPVNVYGRQYDVFRIRKATESYGIKVIEDLAESHGVKPSYNADAACWSFYKNKIVAGEEGGAVWFRDPEHAALARQLRSLGFTPAHDFNHLPRGWNHRMSNAHAELILASLANFRRNLGWRREIEACYNEHCPATWRMPFRNAPWVYDVRIPEMRGRHDLVVEALNAKGIAARHAFKPMSWQEEFKRCRLVTDGREHRAARAAVEVLYLPIVPGKTTEKDCRLAFWIIEDVLGE